MQKEKTIQRNKINNKKYNTYDLTSDYGVGYTFKGEEFFFDLDDYNKIKDYCWRIDEDGYIATTLNRKNILMHRLVMNCPDDMEVDHKFHNNYDCRKEFLRIVNASQNQMNRRIHKNNTSGVKGVGWHKYKEKWRAYIGINDEQINLGYFNDFEEAVQVRKEAEIKYFGEYRFKENEL